MSGRYWNKSGVSVDVDHNGGIIGDQLDNEIAERVPQDNRQRLHFYEMRMQTLKSKKDYIEQCWFNISVQQQKVIDQRNELKKYEATIDELVSDAQFNIDKLKPIVREENKILAEKQKLEREQKAKEQREKDKQYKLQLEKVLKEREQLIENIKNGDFENV